MSLKLVVQAQKRPSSANFEKVQSATGLNLKIWRLGQAESFILYCNHKEFKDIITYGV